MSEKWISVRKRLPPLERVVVVCFPGYDGAPTYAFGARLDDTDGWLWGIHHGYGGIRRNKDAGWNSIEADDDYQVTHWQPLAQPPFHLKAVPASTKAGGE